MYYQFQHVQVHVQIRNVFLQRMKCSPHTHSFHIHRHRNATALQQDLRLLVRELNVPLGLIVTTGLLGPSPTHAQLAPNTDGTGRLLRDPWQNNTQQSYYNQNFISTQILCRLGHFTKPEKDQSETLCRSGNFNQHPNLSRDQVISTYKL